MFLASRKRLFLVLFAGFVVVGMFFAGKGAIMEKNPLLATQKGKQGNELNFSSYCQGDKIVRQEADRNRDGKTDIWRYSEDGVLMRSEVDSDYDGNIDYWAYYKDGRIEKQEIDRDNNGMKDAWAYLEQGLKVRQEVDSNHDGKVDTWFYYKMGKLCGRVRDTDFDGKIDEVLGEVPVNDGSKTYALPLHKGGK